MNASTESSRDTPHDGSTDAPTVSIVVPNYNYAHHLPERLDTLFAQTFGDFEVLVLDDASTDDSRSVIDAYADRPNVRVAINEENSGSVFRQWNRGVEMARGRYVWIAEADDAAEPTFLERLVGVLEDDPDVAFVYSESAMVDDNGTLLGLTSERLNYEPLDQWRSDFIHSGEDEIRSNLAYRNTVPNASAVVFRRDLYRAAGGADATYTCLGDWDMWAKLAMAGGVGYIAEPLNRFRFHAGTVRSSLRWRPSVLLEDQRRIAEYLDGQLDLDPPAWPVIFRTAIQGWAVRALLLDLSRAERREAIECIRLYDPNPRWRLVKEVVGVLWRGLTRPKLALRYVTNRLRRRWQ